MYASLSRFTTKYRAIIIAVWFVAAAVLFVFAPKLSNVGVSDESQFLPQDTESSTASRLLKEKFTSAEQASGGNGVLIIYDSNGLSAADLQATQKIHDWLISAAAPAEIQGVTSIYESEILKSTLISSDQTTMMMNINFSVGALSDNAKKAVADIRDYIHRNYPNEHIYLTGQIGLFQDLMSSVAQTISRTTIVTIVLVSILLLIIYRSPVAMLLPLLAIGISYLVSSGIIGFLGQAGAKFSTLTEAYLIVIIFGVGTDYCLFIVSRFREELGHKDWGEAQSTTIRQIAPVIAASALTVIVAFLSMGISRFGMNQTTGYGLAIGVAITLLAGLTLVPALMAFFGKHLFWPVKVVGVKHDGGFGWKTIGEWVGKRPLLVVIPITIILFLPFIALPNLKTSVDIINQLPQSSESVKGYKIMVGHFPVGELSPCYVLIEKKEGNIFDNDSLQAIARLAQNLQSVNGISRVDYYSAPAAQISGMAQQIKTLGDAIGTGSGLDQLTSLQTVGQSLQTLVLRYPGMAQSTNFQQTIAGITQAPVIAGKISTASLADIPALLGQLQKTIYGISDSLTGLAGEFNLQGNTPLTSYLHTTYFSTDKTIARINIVFGGDPDASTTLAAVARVRSAVSNDLKSSSLAGNSYYVGGESAVRADMMLINESDFGRV
ncbi:MAG TPA: MMPL family transporter, partial [Dehalococcoidales bacterium]|nr:MMPL family transporter [Dehalococcoidales bacterium]